MDDKTAHLAAVAGDVVLYRWYFDKYLFQA
jgi:hypothetical protein